MLNKKGDNSHSFYRKRPYGIKLEIFILFFLGEEDEDDRKKKNSYNSSSKTREKSHSSGFTGMTGSQKTKTAGATPNSMGDSSSG